MELESSISRTKQALRVAEAQAERDAIIAQSEGRAHALRAMERIKAAAREEMVQTVEALLDALARQDQEEIALQFVSVIRDMTQRVGQDDLAMMRYVEAMQAIVKSGSPTSFVITPPAPSPGMMPSPPPPRIGPGGQGNQEEQ
jgi:hypothetical protein